jgi:hypothetical protein
LNSNIDSDVGSIEMQVLDVIEDEVGDNFHNILLSFCDLHKQNYVILFPLTNHHGHFELQICLVCFAFMYCAKFQIYCDLFSSKM